jgi:hypothetical protein
MEGRLSGGGEKVALVVLESVPWISTIPLEMLRKRHIERSSKVFG